MVRGSVGDALKQLGCRVIDAVNAADALDNRNGRRGEIYLLLTDLVLPGELIGDELATLLLKDNPRLKVLFASGYSTEVAGKLFSLEEEVNFLIKPYQLHKRGANAPRRIGWLKCRAMFSWKDTNAQF